MLKNTLLLGVALFATSSSYADPVVRGSTEDTQQSPLFLSQSEQPKKDLLSKCILLGKAVSAGSLGAFLGAMGLACGSSIGRALIQKQDLLERLKTILGITGFAGTSLIIAAQLGGYSIDSFREIAGA